MRHHRHTPRRPGMARSLYRLVVPILALAIAAQLFTTRATATPAGPEGTAATHEIVTWGASADRMGEAVSNRSHRLIVRTSAGGTDLRIRLSNAFGDRPLTFGQAYAGVQKEGAALVGGQQPPYDVRR